jgi:hypothetical protein
LGAGGSSHAAHRCARCGPGGQAGSAAPLQRALGERQAPTCCSTLHSVPSSWVACRGAGAAVRALAKGARLWAHRCTSTERRARVQRA